MSQKKNVSKKNTVAEGRKQYALSTVLLFFIICAGITAFLFYGGRGEKRRDEERNRKIQEIIQVVESHHIENNKYPEAIFFTADKALICSNAACFDEEVVPLSGATQAVDFSQRTTSISTKYGYVLESGGYGIGYCNESGEIVSFGNIDPSNLMLNCN